jgi:hypothetical protein
LKYCAFVNAKLDMNLSLIKFVGEISRTSAFDVARESG